jgi:anti-sigma-K factor RskA
MNADDRDLLAGEYVLGTLSEAERARVEAAWRGDNLLRARVEWWQRSLAPLIGAGPVPVPAHVWQRIASEM